MMSWIIVSKHERDEETGELLVWNNEWGFICDPATIFDTQDYNLPLDGEWEQFE